MAILDHEGGVLAGRVYSPPDEMLGLLEQVIARFPEPLASTSASPRKALGQTPAGSASESPDEAILKRLEGIYDPQYGGFGLEPKQPPWEGLRLLLDLYGRSG